MKKRLNDIVRDATDQAAKKWDIENLPEVVLDIPKDKKLADLSLVIISLIE